MTKLEKSVIIVLIGMLFVSATILYTRSAEPTEVEIGTPNETVNTGEAN